MSFVDAPQSSFVFSFPAMSSAGGPVLDRGDDADALALPVHGDVRHFVFGRVYHGRGVYAERGRCGG